MNVRSALEYVPHFCGRLFVVHVAGGLLPAEELASSGLHRPAVSTDDLGDSTQEPYLGQP